MNENSHACFLEIPNVLDELGRTFSLRTLSLKFNNLALNLKSFHIISGVYLLTLLNNE